MEKEGRKEGNLKWLWLEEPPDNVVTGMQKETSLPHVQINMTGLTQARWFRIANATSTIIEGTHAVRPLYLKVHAHPVDHFVAMNRPHRCSPAELLCSFAFHPFTISS